MIEKQPFQSHLSESPLLRELSEREAHVLYDHMQHLEYKTGQLIITQGTENKGLWLVESGTCQVIRENGTGSKEQLLAELNGGAVFGEMSFFSQKMHSASIRTTSAVLVHQLTQTAFQELCETEAATAIKIQAHIVQVMADRLQRMDQWVCELIETNAQDNSRKRDEWHDFRAKLYSDWNFS